MGAGLGIGVIDGGGTWDEIGRESDTDDLTGLSGSAPVFPAPPAKATMRAAHSRGLDHRVARRAVDAVFVGSRRPIGAYGINSSDTVETFPADRGATAAAIEAMRAAGLETAVHAGLEAALHRSGQTSRGD